MPLSLQTVCVVIPIYRAALSASELAALDQCVSVLRQHPIILVKPENLDITPLMERCPHLQHENFREDFFAGIAGYNSMLLSDEFYARFADYEFMLVHQLDAFVFSDQLLHWCSRNYDYIGAPWLPKAVLPNLAKKIYIALRRKIYRLINKRTDESCPGSMSKYQYFYSTGNGGFSLRRVAKMREMLATLSDTAELYRSGKCHPWAEDIFFSVEANRFWNRLRVPTMKESAHFSWELNPAAGSKLTSGNLPFGCHGWDKYYRKDWLPIFAQLGYSLDELGPALN